MNTNQLTAVTPTRTQLTRFGTAPDFSTKTCQVSGSQLTMLSASENYDLNIRQGPERARVVGVKEKDRKPVDPPPIIQLHIRDASDPAQNYLQSPYYFMACNLWDATNEHAAQTGSLAGTCVSSLHRLKDIDNTDGGFFVFGDLSVKLEGHFRLRFSLFEMVDNSVVYIKSVVSTPFEVFVPKNFPGMSESTFLSRSFGDQGVRLRIRKEPRTLLKRSAPTSLQPNDYSRLDPSPIRQDPLNGPNHVQFVPAGSYGTAPARESQSEYNEPSAKRQRTSIDASSRDTYSHSSDYAQSNYTNQPGSTSAYSTPNQHSSTYGASYPRTPLSAPSGVSEFSFRAHPPQLGSLSTSSSYGSSGSQPPGYLPSQPSEVYQQHPAYTPQTYQSSQYPQANRQMPQLIQSATPRHQFDSGEYIQEGVNAAYNRQPALQDSSISHSENRSKPTAVRSNYNIHQNFPQTEHLMGPPFQNRQDVSQVPLSNVLPPLQSTVQSISQPSSLASTYPLSTNLTSSYPSSANLASAYSNHAASNNQVSANHNLSPHSTAPFGSQRYQDAFASHSQETLGSQSHRDLG